MLSGYTFLICKEYRLLEKVLILPDRGLNATCMKKVASALMFLNSMTMITYSCILYSSWRRTTPLFWNILCCTSATCSKSIRMKSRVRQHWFEICCSKYCLAPALDLIVASLADFLAADQQLAVEIEYDMKRFEEQRHQTQRLNASSSDIQVQLVFSHWEFFVF